MSGMKYQDTRSGWVVVAAASGLTFGVWAANGGFGVFLLTLEDTFGWSRGNISVANSLNLVVGGSVGFALGATADRIGPQKVLALGALVTAIGFVLLGTTMTQLWQFYLIQGLLMGVAMSSLYFLPLAVVSRWFVRQRGLALGILLAANSFAVMVSAPLTTALIEAFDWRRAYLFLAGLVALTIPLAAFLIKSPSSVPVAERGHRPDAAAPSEAGLTAGEAIKDRRLWLFWLSWLSYGFIVMMLAVHMVPFGKSLGNTIAQASVAMTFYGIGSIIARLVLGTIADRIGAVRVFWLSITLQVASLFGFLLNPPLGAFYLWAIVFGIGSSGFDVAILKGIAEAFGTRSLGTIMGITSLGFRLGAASGPAAAGYIFDATGQYTFSIAAGVLTSALCAVFFALATSPSRRRVSAYKASVPDVTE